MTDFSFPNAPAAEDLILPAPPVLEAGKEQQFLKAVEQYLKSVFLTFTDLDTSIKQGWLIKDARIVNLDASKITANSILTQVLYVGNQKFALDGTQTLLIIQDNQATPTTRVKIGKLGTGNQQYGIQVMDNTGTVKFQASDTTFIDGAVITNATITGSKIVTDGSTGVSTSNINTNAISGFGQTSFSSVAFGTTETNLGSVTISVNNTGDGVIIASSGYSLIYTNGTVTQIQITTRLYRDATVIATQITAWETTSVAATYAVPISFSYIDSGVAGSHTYKITNQVTQGSIGVSSSNSTGRISALDIKR